MKTYKIKKHNEAGDFKQGTLKSTVEEINKVLGFKSNIKDDPYKVKYSWGFTANGVKCAIWDYKGSHEYNQFSFFGPQEIFIGLFGSTNVAEL